MVYEDPHHNATARFRKIKKEAGETNIQHFVSQLNCHFKKYSLIHSFEKQNRRDLETPPTFSHGWQGPKYMGRLVLLSQIPLAKNLSWK